MGHFVAGRPEAAQVSGPTDHRRLTVQDNYMRLGAITVMQNLRAMVGRHEAKFSGRSGPDGSIPPVIGTTCDISIKLVSMYARATQRVFPELGFVRTIEIARVAVSPRYRGRGFFKQVLKEVEDLADMTGRVVYIESVVNDDLHAHMSRRGGYLMTPGDFGAASFYRRPVSLQEAIKECGKCGK